MVEAAAKANLKKDLSWQVAACMTYAARRQESDLLRQLQVRDSIMCFTNVRKAERFIAGLHLLSNVCVTEFGWYQIAQLGSSAFRSFVHVHNVSAGGLTQQSCGLGFGGSYHE